MRSSNLLLLGNRWNFGYTFTRTIRSPGKLDRNAESANGPAIWRLSIEPTPHPRVIVTSRIGADPFPAIEHGFPSCLSMWNNFSAAEKALYGSQPPFILLVNQFS